MSGYSFSASSAIYKAVKNSTNFSMVTGCTGVSVGVTYDSNSLPPCSGKTFTISGISYRGVSSNYGSSLSVVVTNLKNGRRVDGKIIGEASSCTTGINPDTGLCKPKPPFCSSPIVEELRQEAQMKCALKNGKFTEVCDPETETYIPHCDEPPPPIDKYCDSPEVAAMKSEGHAACVAKGGSYDFVCKEPNSFTDSCSNIPPVPPDPDPPECVPVPENNWCDNPEPDKCIIGGNNWPQCEPWYGKDPTSPLDPVNPPTVDPTTPSIPRPVNPLDPPLPNVPFDGTRIVESIQNLNLDMNFGFSDTNNALQLQTNVLSSTNELVYNGLMQDIKIYENTKLLQLKNTGDIVDAIGSIPEPVPYDDSGVIMAIEELGNKIGAGDCVPTEDNNYCENPHGLDQEYIATMFGQLNEVLDSELSAADSTILGSMSELATKPPVDESTVSPFLDWNISILTSNNQCVSMDWYGHELTCEFSDNFKSIFGFILFMMTLHTVIGILMEDITPNQKSYGHRRR